MLSRRRSNWLVLAVLVTTLVGAAARGQEKLFKDDVASNMTLRQAAEEARRSHKVLIARFALPPAPQGRRPLWENDTVKAWVRWHAIVVDVDGEELAALKSNYGFGEPERKWGAYYFANNKRLKLFWPRTIWLPSALPDRHRVFKPGMDDSFEQHWPTAVMAVHQFQLNFERASAAMPVWGEQHIKDNPSPAPPPRRDLYREDDGFAEVVRDPREADRRAGRPAGRVDVLAKLEEARAAAKAGNVQLAMGLYTWLWERGAEEDPAFNVTRLTAVLTEIKPLADQVGSAARRVERIIAAELEQYPWGEYQDRYEYLRLVRVLGAGDDIVTRLDIEVNDPDEQSMLPAEDALAIRLMIDRLEAAPDQPVTPVWVEKQMAFAAKSPPLRIPAAAWKSQAEFRRWMAAHEAVRSYALRLASGQEEAAAAIAEAAIRAAGDEPVKAAAVRRALVCTAVAAGQRREAHSTWVAEAAKLDPALLSRGEDPLAARAR